MYQISGITIPFVHKKLTVNLPFVHPLVNVVGFVTTIGSAVVGFAASNPQLVAGLFPVKYASAVTLVLGAVATLWPDKRAEGENARNPAGDTISPSENSTRSDILPMEGNMATTTTTETVPGEIADALVTALQSAPAQQALLAAITAGETTVVEFADNAINNAKGSGALGIFIAATKGTVETEFNAEVAKFTPAQIAAIITKAAVTEAKNLGG